MQSVDIAILVIIAFSAITGMIYGFLNILFSLIAWSLAFIIAMKFSPILTPLLESSVTTPILRTTIAFAGLFVISLMILTGITYLIMKLLSRVGLTATDRILGLFFGIALGLITVEVLIFLGGFTALPQKSWWDDSRIIKSFERVAVWSGQYLPENLSEYHDYNITKNRLIREMPSEMESSEMESSEMEPSEMESSEMNSIN